MRDRLRNIKYHHRLCVYLCICTHTQREKDRQIDRERERESERASEHTVTVWIYRCVCVCLIMNSTDGGVLSVPGSLVEKSLELPPLFNYYYTYQVFLWLPWPDFAMMAEVAERRLLYIHEVLSRTYDVCTHGQTHKSQWTTVLLCILLDYTHWTAHIYVCSRESEREILKEKLALTTSKLATLPNRPS